MYNGIIEVSELAALGTQPGTLAGTGGTLVTIHPSERTPTPHSAKAKVECQENNVSFAVTLRSIQCSTPYANRRNHRLTRAEVLAVRFVLAAGDSGRNPLSVLWQGADYCPPNGLCFTCGPDRPASALQVTRTSGRSIIEAREGALLLPLTTTFQQGKPASASNC